MFMGKMIPKEEDNICRRALMNETILGANGLSKECKDLAKKIGLPDLRFNPVTKGEIKKLLRNTAHI